MGTKISALPTGSAYMGSQWIVGVEAGASVKFSPSQTNPFRGDWAGTTSFPTTGGRFTAGVPAAGDKWRLTSTLTIGGTDIYPPGTIIEAIQNTPGQTNSNWIKYAAQM